jgi:acyl-CoA thioesterase
LKQPGPPAGQVPTTATARERPFVDHLGLHIAEHRAGFSRCTLQVAHHHFNSAGLVHGAVLFALADTGMGAALYPGLEDTQICATIEIKINYFKPVTAGQIVCTSELIHRGRTIAHLESSLFAADTLVAKANGSFAIIQRRTAHAA